MKKQPAFLTLSLGCQCKNRVNTRNLQIQVEKTMLLRQVFLKKVITIQEVRREYSMLLTNQVLRICKPLKLFSLMPVQNISSQMLSNMQNNILKKSSNLLHNYF